MRCCMIALEDALIGIVTWPDKVERTRISTEFAKKGFRGCVGFVDGTLLPLSQRPVVDGEVYFDHKKCYSLNMQVTCDDRKKILHMYRGLPGSCQDTTCLKASPLWCYIDDPRTFSSGEYLLGDSGYPGLRRVVPSFKYGVAADPDKETFNYCVAKTRIANEHCIGILKSRWHSLKELKTQLKKGPTTSVWMIIQIECCVRLHNFVHNQQDEWLEDDGPIEIEADLGAEEDYEINADVEESNHHGTVMRTHVMQECLEINRRPGGFLTLL